MANKDLSVNDRNGNPLPDLVDKQVMQDMRTQGVEVTNLQTTNNTEAGLEVQATEVAGETVSEGFFNWLRGG